MPNIIKLADGVYIKNFSVNIFSYWGGLMNNSFSGSLLIFATIFGLVSLLKRNALPALYIFSCIFAAILMQIKSGSISLRFSSQGLVFVPIILGEALARIDKLGTKFSIRVYSKIAVILVSCLFLITNIISISWLWGKRSYAKEIVDNVANQKQPVQLFVVRPVAKSLQYYFKQKGLGFREYVNLEEFEHPTEPNNLRLIIMCYLVPSRLVYSANKHYVRLRGWAESFTIVLPSEYSDLFKKYEHNK